MQSPESKLTPSSYGAVRRTSKAEKTPRVTQSYSTVSKAIRQQGLLDRTLGFYGAPPAAGLLVALAAAIAGFVLLGDSWFQLLIAAALGVIFTHFAFLAHEASHRQVLTSGRANDRLGRFLHDSCPLDRNANITADNTADTFALAA